MYRYYSTERPVSLGTYPKIMKNRPVNIKNFETKKYVPEIGREAYGYLEYERRLTNKGDEHFRLYIGKVKDDCSKEIQGIESVKLILLDLGRENEFYVSGAPTIEDMERFYRNSYETGLKDSISEDYNYCLWYLLDPCCELICTIKKDDVEVLREMTKEDDEFYGKSFEKFKKIHKFAEIEQQLKDEDTAEEKANEEFKKAKKTKIEIRTRSHGNMTIDAVIYKGFGIHDWVASNGVREGDTSKTITILSGKGKGLSLTSCSVAKYKQLIDEVIKTIGDRPIKESDGEKLIPIFSKYQ